MRTAKRRPPTSTGLDASRLPAEVVSVAATSEAVVEVALLVTIGLEVSKAMVEARLMPELKETGDT